MYYVNNKQRKKHRAEVKYIKKQKKMSFFQFFMVVDNLSSCQFSKVNKIGNQHFLTQWMSIKI